MVQSKREGIGQYDACSEMNMLCEGIKVLYMLFFSLGLEAVIRLALVNWMCPALSRGLTSFHEDVYHIS